MMKMWIFLTLGFSCFAQVHQPYKCSGSIAPLFQNDELLSIDLHADFNIINGAQVQKRSAFSKGTLKVHRNVDQGLDVKVQARGNSRFSLCDWRPLKIIFDHKTENFDLFSELGKSVKLVTHCGDSASILDNFHTRVENSSFKHAHDTYSRRRLLLEYSVYKILESIVPTAIKTRLVEMNYKSSKGEELKKEFAFFRESDHAIKRRCELFEVNDKTPRSLFKNINMITQVDFLNLLVNNYDYAPVFNHNLKVFQDKQYNMIIFPYNFDLSATVNFHERSLENNLSLKAFINQNSNNLRDFLKSAKGRKLDEIIMLSLITINNTSNLDHILKNIPLSITSRKYINEWHGKAIDVLKERVQSYRKYNNQKYLQMLEEL